MIQLQGVLSVRTINGQYGPFNVGRLITELGEFAIKDPVIDQYEEGKYEGSFVVSKIYPTSYFAGGRMVMEVRAKLDDMTLDGVDSLSDDERKPVDEPDPIDESSRPSVEQAEPVSSQSAAEAAAEEHVEAPAGEQPPATADDEPLSKLFGHLWPLEDVVKLDPTVDRKLFREQRDALKQLGYSFKPEDQAWSKA